MEGEAFLIGVKFIHLYLFECIFFSVYVHIYMPINMYVYTILMECCYTYTHIYIYIHKYAPNRG
jgi:hypothetical protein